MENGALVFACEHFLEKRALALARAPLSTLCSVILPFGALAGFMRRFSVRPSRSDNPYNVLEEAWRKTGPTLSFCVECM